MTVIISGTDGVSDVDGDASTPALRGTDANTGIFFGADIIGFSEGGAECARFNADAQFVAAAGTASLPVITTTGDVNTGIFFPAADIIATSTGGTERNRTTAQGYFKASPTGTYTGATGTNHEFLGETPNGYTVLFRCTSAAPLNHYISEFKFTASTPNNTTTLFNECRDATAARIELRSNGGIANFSANNVNLSDRREKTNFAPAKSYLDTICAIPVQTFNYIDQNMEEDGGLTLGVVAQDVQEVAPELVMESNWAGKDEEPKMRLSIYQTDFQYALMKCIQEQQALITALTARVAALEAK